LDIVGGADMGMDDGKVADTDWYGAWLDLD